MLFIANWKMKIDVATTIALTDALSQKVRTLPEEAEIVLCPSYLGLMVVSARLKGSGVKLGAQDCFWEGQGAFTGEVSPDDLRMQGCKFVILGHSERRQYLAETNEQIHRKLQAALRAGLTPVLCIGEDYQQRANNQKDYVLIKQLQEALQGIALGQEDRLVVAYEPVWAISTGGVGIEATPDEVQYASEVIRHIIIDLFGAASLKQNVQIVYGGSVNPNNVKAFTALPAMSGVLVGGASLKAEEFIKLIRAALDK